MLKGRRTRKAIAATLLLIFATNTFAPTAAYALTSGPTAPEATSFEPVDTTDMVNLQTGDFTYNIPLLEVPGPEGGYPLSLSYHAGIQPNEDASWVGLGWTLNPGAINRNVNGYPDDWFASQNNQRVYWAGGTTTTYNVGISIGSANTPASASFGLSFSSDTYQGFGVGFNMGIGGRIGGESSPFGIGVGVGVSPYGDPYAGAEVKVKGLNASAGIGVSTNFESVNASVNGNVSLIGASLSTGGNKPSFEVGGLSASVSSTSQAGIQTKSKSFGVDIPTPWGFSLSLGYKKNRYWTDEKTTVYTHGSLNSSGFGEGDDRAYDTYSLLEDAADKNMIDYPDPTKLQGGAFMDFDVYSVNAQGLGGNMRPYLLQGEVMGQNRKTSGGSPINNYYSPAVTNFTPAFRFIGDFSNSFRQNYPGYNDPNLNLRLVEPPFDTAPLYGDATDPLGAGYGWGGMNKLAGSRYIQIGPVIKPSVAAGYTKTDRYQSYMIEGFSITNESGVIYHYGLPAYTWAEENFQKKISEANGLAFNRSTKGNPYAYTWYLTTITGPDFVDRNLDGKADANDWGYYINFEYGKWSNNYTWRNPSEGYHRDEDNEWQNCSMGKKEVYYLNAVRTRTHVALFEKSPRFDGKGSSPEVFTKQSGTKYTNDGVFNYNSSQSLRLDKIYLLNAADYNFVTNTSGSNSAYVISSRNNTLYPECELGGNIFDKADVDAAGRSALEAKSIRVIDFQYDYSLCPGTSNSFDALNNSLIPKGKLTLKSLAFKGKGGVCAIPPTKFEYELSGSEQKTFTGTVNSNGLSGVTTNLEVGEIIKITGSNNYATIVSKTTATDYVVNWLNGGTPSNSNYAFTTTKNPPYNKDAYDCWGNFKSNFNINNSNENLLRATGIISKDAVDVWSLRTINSSLGSSITIRYESDSYNASVLNAGAFVQGEFTRLPGLTYGTNEYDLLLDLASTGYTPSDFFSVNDRIDFTTIQYAHITSGFGGGPGGNATFQRAIDTRNFVSPITILQIGGNGYFNRVKVNISDEFKDYIFNNLENYKNDANNAFTGIIGVFTPYLPGIINGIVNKKNERFGGNIRVKEIAIKDLYTQFSSTSSYNYTHGNNSSIPSGVTSYEPLVFDNIKIPSSYPENIPFYDHTIKSYKKYLYKDMDYLYSIVRETPPPGVMYEYVTVTNSVKNADETLSRTNPGKTVYQFEVFHGNMVGREVVQTQQGSWSGVTHYVKNIAIKKFTGAIGNIKKIIQYDDSGRKLTETINQYLHDGLEELDLSSFMNQYKSRISQFKYQGYLQERTAEVKEVQNSNELNGVKATLSAKEEYPVIPTGQTIINYLNGTKVKSETLAFDFYSGAVTKTVETDAFGNRFMTESVPAYRKYGDMGLKVNTNGNKHMLTQTAATYSYKVDANNTPLGLISASVQTWSNDVDVLQPDYATIKQNNTTNGNVWRPKLSYNWMPEGTTTDGITAIGLFVNFDWANANNPGSQNAGWKKTSEVTLYNVYSNALEAADMNNMYAATKMGYNHSKVMVSGGPAKYAELTYSGAEDGAVSGKFNGDITLGSGVVLDGVATAHTGVKSVKLTNGQTGFYYEIPISKLVAGRDYYASVWAKSSTVATPTNAGLSYSVNGGAAVYASTMAGAGGNGYQLINLKIPGSAITGTNNLKISCYNNHGSDVYFDDLRFHPLNAGVTSYVYDKQSGELTYILDNNNIFTKFEYDAVGRLTKTYRETIPAGVRPVSEYSYNYGQPANCDPPALPTIYAKIFKTDIYNDFETTTATILIKFFSDASCTIPISVSNLDVNYKEVRTNCGGGGSLLVDNYSITCSGTQTSLGTQVIGWDDGIHCWDYTFSVTTGSGYIVGN